MQGTSTLETIAAPIAAPIAPAVPTCGDCSETAAPDGRCLNIGACRTADSAASRQSRHSGAGSSGRAGVSPRAWTIAGRVD